MPVPKFFLLKACLIFQITFANAQTEAINWAFGSNVGLSFTTSPPTTVAGYAINTYEGCAIISDSVGDLLFYTDGVTVWNQLHQVMPNGTGLQGHSSSSQSAIIIPAPGSTGVYYIVTAPENSSGLPMSYSIVDMGLSGGLGSVVIKNVTLYTSTTEKVSVTRHQNGTDYWILTHEYGTADFRTYLVTSTGINPNWISSTAGNAVTVPEHKIGMLKISPCGTHVAMTNHGLQGFIPSTFELFSFNNATGQVSNPMQLASGLDGIFGTEFSANNQKLYMAYSEEGVLVQYDISSGNMATIIASADTIGNSSFTLGSLQLGPDGKIYVAKYNSLTLGCIENPTLPGQACNYNNTFVNLGDSCLLGLPGFVASWFCDPSSGISDVIEESISVSPNPFISDFTITFSAQHPDYITVNLVDLNGNEVLISQKAERGNNQIEISVDGISSGVYILTVTSANHISRHKVIKL